MISRQERFSRIWLRAPVLVAAAALLPHVAQAQTAGPTAAATDSLRVRRLVQRLGTYVRLSQAGVGRAEGHLIAVSDELELRWSDTTVAIPVSTVDTLWVRRNGAGYGLLVGALMGGAAARGFARSVDRFYTGQATRRWGAFAVGALAGGLVGAVGGSTFKYWRQQFP